MAKVGNWGKYLKFETSDARILTFNNFRRDFAARTALHNPIEGKPVVEFLGNELQSITFSISVSAARGVTPKQIEQKLMSYISSGRVAPLVIGKRTICTKAMLTSFSSAYGVIMDRGELYSAQFEITMTEYR